jgi:hypothetical protein
MFSSITCIDQAAFDPASSASRPARIARMTSAGSSAEVFRRISRRLARRTFGSIPGGAWPGARVARSAALPLAGVRTAEARDGAFKVVAALRDPFVLGPPGRAPRDPPAVVALFGARANPDARIDEPELFFDEPEFFFGDPELLLGEELFFKEPEFFFEPWVLFRIMMRLSR